MAGESPVHGPEAAVLAPPAATSVIINHPPLGDDIPCRPGKAAS